MGEAKLNLLLVDDEEEDLAITTSKLRETEGLDIDAAR